MLRTLLTSEKAKIEARRYKFHVFQYFHISELFWEGISNKELGQAKEYSISIEAISNPN